MGTGYWALGQWAVGNSGEGAGNSRDKVRSEEDKLLSLMMQMPMRNGHFIVMANGHRL